MRVKLFLFIIVQLSVTNINAQNLENSFGGVKTNFQLYSDTTNLKVTDQIIIKRAAKKSHGGTLYDAAWGYAYQSLHIEFVTKERLVKKIFKYKAGRNNNDKLELTFYDSNNVVLASHISDFSIVDLSYNSSSNISQLFYSIDLVDIPIVLLNKTVKINLIKKVSDRNK